MEMLTTLALIGIIISIVYPSYHNYLARSRQTEITTLLLRGAANMERYYDDSTGYANATREQIFGNALANRNYTFDVTATATTFQLTATLSNGNNLDHNCTSLAIDQEGNRTPIHCWL